MASGRQHWKTRDFDSTLEFRSPTVLEFWPDARYPTELVDRVDIDFSEDENYEDRKYEHSGVATSELGSGL